MHALVKEEGHAHKLWRFQNTLEYRVERLTSYWMNSPSQTDHWLETILLYTSKLISILNQQSCHRSDRHNVLTPLKKYSNILAYTPLYIVVEIRIRNWSTEDRTFYRLSVSVPLKCTGNWPTKMDFDWPNAEIDWKIANDRLLFLALNIHHARNF